MKIRSLCSLLPLIDSLKGLLISGTMDIETLEVTLHTEGSGMITSKKIKALYEHPKRASTLENLSVNNPYEKIQIFNLTMTKEGSFPILWIENKAPRSEELSFIGYPLFSDMSQSSLDSIAKYETIFSHFSGVFCILNNLGEIERINKKGVTILGFKDKDVIDHNFEDFLITPASLEKIESLQQSREYEGSVEVCLMRADGSHFMGLASVNKVLDEQENLLYRFLFVIDITDQVNLIGDSMKASMDLLDSNEYLKKTQTTLLKTERMASIGVLGAGLAHEINNPLSYMQNNLTLIKEYIPTIERYRDEVQKTSLYDESGLGKVDEQLDLSYIFDELKTMIAEMDEGLMHIGKIVHSLKSFSGKENRGGWNYEDVNKAIGEMLLICKNEYKYTTEVITDLGDIPRISCELSELNQALLAIFLNGVQSISENPQKSIKGIIEIATERIDDNRIRIVITDNGVPFDEKDIERAFEPFFSGWKINPGSGMGLTVTRHIVVNKHKGELFIERDNDKNLLCMILPINRHEETP